MLEKDILRKELEEKNKEKLLNDLRNMDDTYNNLFYKVDHKIRKEILEEDDKKVKEYIGELMYHQSEFYEQLLVNLGIEFKLRAYQLHKNDYALNRAESNSGETILKEFEQRVNFIMANPFLDLYYRLEFGDELEDENKEFSKLVMKVVQRYIKELLKMVFFNVRGMVQRDVVYKDNKDTLSFVYHGYYLQYMDYTITQLLDEVFSVIRDKDEPWSDEESNVYDLLLNLGYCFCSPKSDPLKAYYG